MSPPVPTNYSIRREPITIAVDISGGHLISGEWNLSVNSAGEAQLVIRSQPTNHSVQFHVPPEKLDELRELLVRERFFELSSDYGQIVPDSSTGTVTIVVGEFTQTVRLHFLMNWVHNDPSRLVEAARAVRVGMLIRGWFQDDRAVDTREYYQMVLDAAKKSTPK